MDFGPYQSGCTYPRQITPHTPHTMSDDSSSLDSDNYGCVAARVSVPHTLEALCLIAPRLIETWDPTPVTQDYLFFGWLLQRLSRDFALLTSCCCKEAHTLCNSATMHICTSSLLPFRTLGSGLKTEQSITSPQCMVCVT